MAPPPRRDRTAKEDNCGTRFVRRSVLLPARPRGVVPATLQFAETTQRGASTGPARVSGTMIVRWSDGSSTTLDCARYCVDQHGSGHEEQVVQSVEEGSPREDVLCARACATVTVGEAGSADASAKRCFVVARGDSDRVATFFLVAAHKSVMMCRLVNSAQEVEVHANFDVGPLGLGLVAYDTRCGQFATVSAEPIVGPRVGGKKISTGRFMASIWAIEQNRHHWPLTSLVK